MKKYKTEIDGVYIIETFNAQDDRGSFNKIYNEKTLNEINVFMEIKEIYYSSSKKNVIRGMHFQTPPFEHDKIVTVISGKVEDVIVDLRMNSKTYGKCISVELDGKDNKMILIPKGCAHGFKSLEDNTIMMYMVSSIYSKENDTGIKWDSIDYDWNINTPIISERDNSFVKLQDYKSPF